MAAISATDWGRIYAYIWKDTKTGGDLKTRFERDPASVIKEITTILGIAPYDRLFDIVIDPTFTVSELNSIMNGTAPPPNFMFFLRLTC